MECSHAEDHDFRSHPSFHVGVDFPPATVRVRYRRCCREIRFPSAVRADPKRCVRRVDPHIRPQGCACSLSIEWVVSGFQHASYTVICRSIPLWRASAPSATGTALSINRKRPRLGMLCFGTTGLTAALPNDRRPPVDCTGLDHGFLTRWSQTGACHNDHRVTSR